MKVYVVFKHYHYYDSVVLGVFSEEILAAQYIENIVYSDGDITWDKCEWDDVKRYKFTSESGYDLYYQVYNVRGDVE